MQRTSHGQDGDSPLISVFYGPTGNFGEGLTMGFWRRVEERFWTGPVTQDYGTIAEEQAGMGRRRISALIGTKDGQGRFFLRITHVAPFAANLNFLDFDREAVVKLKSAIDDALGRM